MARQARAESTRSQLLGAAEATFAELGYDASSVAAICQRASVSKGAFYHHFASKQALFLELLEEWLARLDEQLVQAREGTDSVPAALASMAESGQQVFADAHGRLPLFLAFWAQAVRDEQSWQATIAPYRRYQAFFTELVRQGIAEGSLHDADPQRAARIIVALAVGLLLQGVLDPEGADWGAVMEEGIELLLGGLARRT